jgi:hypothetical protein
MRTATLIVFVLLVVSATAVSAQIPFIAAYFDHTYQTEAQPPYPATDPCPGVGQLGELFIALVNANVFVSGVEFAVNYPPAITWLSDNETQPVTIGTTPAGLSMGWSTPQNGFKAVFVCRVVFMWNCDSCDQQFLNNQIVVVPHPATFLVGYTDFPGFNQLNAVGLTSLICATIPAEETTWGKVKALYGE